MSEEVTSESMNKKTKGDGVFTIVAIENKIILFTMHFSERVLNVGVPKHLQHLPMVDLNNQISVAFFYCRASTTLMCKAFPLSFKQTALLGTSVNRLVDAITRNIQGHVTFLTP